MSKQGRNRMRYNTVITGGSRVGKSAFMARLIINKFIDDPYAKHELFTNIWQELPLTDGIVYRKKIEFEEEPGVTQVIKILDTSTENEFGITREQYMQANEGFILLYSITSRESFEEAKVFHYQISRVKRPSNLSIILIGNKCDLEDEREVTTDEGRDFAQQWGCLFMETSTKQPINVEEAFFEFVREMRAYRQPYPQSVPETPNAGCCSGCIVA